MQKSKTKKLTLASDFDEIIKIESFIRKLVDPSGKELFNKVELAVNEAVTNAVIHGNKQDTTKRVYITAQRDDKKIEVTVKDEGLGFNPENLPDPTDEKQLLKPGGRGVFLIKQNADEVTFEENATLVRMIFYIA